MTLATKFCVEYPKLNWIFKKLFRSDMFSYHIKQVHISFDTDRCWFNNERELHRDKGPALIRSNGNKGWYLNGKRHRADGPAIEGADGHKEWYLNGKLHREDGPAIEFANGDKEWFINGQRHREDGPAVESVNGYKIWYYHGKKIKCSSQKEFEKLIKLKGFW